MSVIKAKKVFLGLMIASCFLLVTFIVQDFVCNIISKMQTINLTKLGINQVNNSDILHVQLQEMLSSIKLVESIFAIISFISASSFVITITITAIIYFSYLYKGINLFTIDASDEGISNKEEEE